MDKHTKAKKILRIVANVLLGIFLAVSVFAVVLTIVSKKDADGAAEIFGYQMRIVTSESMGESPETDISKYEIGSIPIKSMVFIQVEPEDEDEAEKWYADIKVGDVLTFKYYEYGFYKNQQVVITHRVVSKEPIEGGGYIIELEGDNKSGDQQLLRQTINTTKQSSSTNYIIGKVTGQSYLLGLLITTVQTPLGIVLLIILPCFVIIVFEVVRIVGAISADKKERYKKESDEKSEEIEELKRKLAELENSKANDSTIQESETVSEENKE